MHYHGVMEIVPHMNITLLIYVSESAKGSDSEDDFLRQKTKAKATSDSDSDSDVGTKKSEKPRYSYLELNLVGS